MELTPFLPVLIFIFIFTIFVSIARNLKKISKKSKKQPSSQNFPNYRKQGWNEFLGDAVIQIRKEIRAAQERQERLTREKSDPGMKRPRRSTLEWDKNAPIPSPPPLPVKDTQKQKKQVRPSETKISGQSTNETPEIAKPVPPPAIGKTAAELQKAVVWSEILAPPLALRKDQDPFRNS